jgi:hypothetical protein
MRRLHDNGGMSRLGAAWVVVATVGLSASSAFAQTPPKPAAPTSSAKPATAQDPPPLPVDIEKIRQGLKRPQPIHIDDQRLRFYVEVRAPEISFMQLVGNYDLMKGPVPGAAITGRDIDRMISPREMYGAAGITATDLVQFAATNFAAQALLRRAAEEIRAAKSQKEVNDIRARIDKELAALMKDKDKSDK